MPYVSEEYEFIYMATPATGSSATLAAFQEWGFGKSYPAEPIRNDSGDAIYAAKHGDYQGFIDHGLMDPKWKDYLTICGIRNPFSFHLNQYIRAETRLRQVDDPNSHFSEFSEEQRMEKKRMFEKIVGQSFKQYMKNKFKVGKEVFLHRKYIEHAQFFIHQEWLEDDIDKLKKKINLPSDFSVPIKGVTPGGPNNREKYVGYYDEDLVEFVYSLNRPFFDRFPEYEF